MEKVKKEFVVLIAIIIVALICISFYIFNASKKNILNNPIISYGYGWKNNESKYGGSEMDFVFNKSGSISFEFNTTSKADQGVEIFIDKVRYILSSPNINQQNLSIKVDRNNSHSVTIRHFCARFDYPCDIKVKRILLDKPAQLWSYKWHNKILSVLGDSLSTIYGKDNYSQILADELGYELHDASVVKSSLTQVKGIDNAILRYKKDILNFQSDAILIFIGTNDAGNGVPLDKFTVEYEKVISDVKKNNPNAKIILVATLPRRDITQEELRPYDSAIKSLSEKFNTNYIDPGDWLDDKDFSDEIHPSIEAQTKIAKNFATEIFPMLK